MLIFRVDNRLVHGQVIEAWLPYTNAKHLIVANDGLASDALRQQIISLAVPERVHIHFVSIANLAHCLRQCCEEKTLVLLENCQDAARAVKLDAPIPTTINIGNLHFSKGKQQLLPHIAVNDEELCLLKELANTFTLDFRSIPTEKVRGIHELYG